jgi:hypothetical protein
MQADVSGKYAALVPSLATLAHSMIRDVDPQVGICMHACIRRGQSCRAQAFEAMHACRALVPTTSAACVQDGLQFLRLRTRTREIMVSTRALASAETSS